MKKVIYFLSIVIKYLFIPLSAESPAVPTATFQEKENSVIDAAANQVSYLQSDTAIFITTN